MKKRLLITNAVIVFLALLLMLIVSSTIIYKENYNVHKTQLKNYLSLTVSSFDGENFKRVENIVNNIDGKVRLTIIYKDGTVVLDTFKDEITENHLTRPEITDLLNVNVRYSATERKQMMYIADFKKDYYIRLAISMGNVNEALKVYILIGIGTLVIIELLSLFLSFYFNKRSLNPINNKIKELSTLANVKFTRSTTIDDLPKIIDNLTVILDEQINKINRQTKEFSTVLDLLNQGIIAIDRNYNIVILNKAALDIFDETNRMISKNYIYLIRDVLLQQKIKYSIDERMNSNYTMKLNCKLFQCNINYVKETWFAGGVIVNIQDITIQQNLEKTKKDFFANASHELKSPLTSIIGYQQMIVEGIADDRELIKNYSSKTLKEANRMNSIIIDMLNLASIEQNYNKNDEKINLKKLLLEIIDSLESKIALKNIKITYSLKEEYIYADATLLDELFRNLIDNAIKYNKENGTINVTLKKKVVIVSDTGIGIPLMYQSRIFERFFRVDKGRSKASGGTGLGLAIVKHICDIYNYKISLKSIEDEGTSIKIDMNR
ncbi:MAG: ATP-binding protein [Candidatus Caccosoma sp.]|nr:ATP-binding protein [Candidatus Caccosoma sp.]